MAGQELARLACILVDYSTQVREGERVLIECSGSRSFPLMRQVYRECLRKGALHVEYQIAQPELTRDFYDLATEIQLGHFPEQRYQLLQKTDVSIGIRAEENLMDLASVPRERIISRTRLLRPLLDWRVNRTRWVVTRLPTPAMAQETGCSMEEMEDIYYGACLQDWAEESRKQERLADLLRSAKTVRITGQETDLVLDIEGMPVQKADGHRNMPDGEVFTAPVLASARGRIRFNCPSYYGGTRFNGVYLEFKEGKAVRASADQGAMELEKMLATDDGASYLGEFAFGLNPGLSRPVGNILFDEKISGSIHLALGNAYEACSNGNRSAIHWDLVRLMKEDGEIWLDGRLLQKNGLFVFPELEDLNPGRARGSGQP